MARSNRPVGASASGSGMFRVLGFDMDSSAPQTVLKGVATASCLCGTAGGIYGGLKHGTPKKFFIYSAVNSGIVAATFFSIREYVVSPILVSTHPARQYQLRRQRLLDNEEPANLSWADIRTSRLLDSGISGGLAGGALNAWKRGRYGLVPGFTTGVLMCTLLQWCFNELSVLRIRIASRHTMYDSVDTGKSSPAVTSTLMATQPVTQIEKAPSLFDRVLSMFGQRISDEKYLERLKAEREAHLRRIAELEGRRER